jgi:hypothetical protein
MPVYLMGNNGDGQLGIGIRGLRTTHDMFE